MILTPKEFETLKNIVNNQIDMRKSYNDFDAGYTRGMEDLWTQIQRMIEISQ